LRRLDGDAVHAGAQQRFDSRDRERIARALRAGLRAPPLTQSTCSRSTKSFAIARAGRSRSTISRVA
jgi:hypothetical protein